MLGAIRQSKQRTSSPLFPQYIDRRVGHVRSVLKADKAGEAMVEPPNVKMIGYNRSTTEPMRVVTFYVSDPDTPFLDPIH